MIQKAFKVVLGIIVLSAGLSACVRTLPNGGLYSPIPNGSPKYPIEVVFGDNEVQRPYDVLQEMSISDEKPLTTNDKLVGGRMIYRGNTNEEKDVMIARLVLDAKKIGADALIKVNYQYFTSATKQGSTVKGVAVKYK